MGFDINEAFRKGASWPPADQQARLKEYEANTDLFDGEHVKVFSQSIHTIRGDVKASLEYVLNWPKAMTLAFADLLVGEPPTPTLPEASKEDRAQLEDYWRRNEVPTRVYEAAIDMSSLGDGVFKSWLKDGKAGLQAVRPDIWFPVFAPGYARKIAKHVLAWTEEDEGGQPVLVVEIHEPGKVEYRRYAVNKPKAAGAGMTIGDRLPLPPGQVETEVIPNDRCLVVSAPNVATSRRAVGRSDYDDISSLVMGLAERFAQVDVILDKHADPKMQGPKKHIKKDDAGESHVDISGGSYFGREKDDPAVEYVTWNGQLDAAFKEIELFKKEFFSLSETTAALFGEVPSGGAMSEAALRWLLMRPLAHVNRMRMGLDPALRYAVTTGLQLEQLAVDDVNIGWQDGLPRDEAAATDMATKRVVAGVWSKARAIQFLDGVDEAGAKKMLDDIDKEKAAAAPKIPIPDARLNNMPGAAGIGAPNTPPAPPQQPAGQPATPPVQ